MKISSLIDKLHFTSTINFEGIPQIDLVALRKSIIKVEEKKNKILFREGAYPKGIYILHKGIIKIYQVNKDGDKQIIYFYGAGELLGYRPLISEEPNPVTAETLEDCVLSFIPKDNFLDVLHKSPALSNLLLKTLSHEFTVWVNIISIFTQQSIKENVALALLLLEEKYGRIHKEGSPIVINMPRKDFANYVGTTTETLVRILRVFKDEKIISAKGRRILIHDKKKLAFKLGETFFA
ncbi:MAG TPA: Crp/Fnr family transcriptional regulator [Bacteroidia bacterium]|jgi:CRP-like cAMP-binding protein|nr:Crp/Fnr family transcriptional regulator [Bacteroidia bacterium]